MMQSWGCSIALHGALCGLGLWLIAQPAIVLEPIFQWEVSLVSQSQPSSRNVPSNDASSQVDSRVHPVVTKAGDKSAAAAPSVQSVTHRIEALREPVLSEAGPGTTQSEVAVAVPNPSDAEDPTAASSSDRVSSPQTVVGDEAQEPQSAHVLSAGADDHRVDGSSDPSTQATGLSSIVTNTSSFETKADFGWLMQMLWSRVSEMKRYPHEARMNQWEGRVIVRVVINAQGQLLDASVAMGSGYAVLDRAALEAIKESCPLTLSQPLGQERIVLRVPIQYRLSS
ncbi:MAG: energy transducer TonB [Nitrospira sp.]